MSSDNAHALQPPVQYHTQQLHCPKNPVCSVSLSAFPHPTRPSLVAQLVKNLLQCGRPEFDPWVGEIPGLVRSPGEGKGYPLQYSVLENFMDCIVHGVAKSQIQLSDFHFHFPLTPSLETTDLFYCFYSFALSKMSYDTVCMEPHNLQPFKTGFFHL